MSNLTYHKKFVHISLRMLSVSFRLVGPMFDYSPFNSKRWDWANVENLSEPNLWIIKTFPCLFLQSPFFLCSLYSETYWHILLLAWFWWWGCSGKIDREESSLRSWNNKSCGWPARYPNQESDHHPNNQFWNFTKIVDLFIHRDHCCINSLKHCDFQFEKHCVSLMSCFKTISLISRGDDLRQNMSEHPGRPRAIVKGYVREGKGKLEAGIAAEER